jgi:hypothetical protein
MWKKQLLQAPLDADEAGHFAKVLGEKYAEVDYRVISKLIKLARLLATSKDTSFGLATLEEAMVLHRGRLLEEDSEENVQENSQKQMPSQCEDIQRAVSRL